MKNLFLTLALMCCVSFAFANEGDNSKSGYSKKDAEKPKVEEEVAIVVAGPWTHCFGLTCTTVCIDYGAEWEDDQVVDAWEGLNDAWCNY